MAVQKEAEVKNTESSKSESETPKNTDASGPKHETHVSREGDSSKSFDSPKRVSTLPHQQAKGGNRSNTGSPMWERKVSSEGMNGAASSTPGRGSRLKPVTLGDESPDDSTAVPVFGHWDDNDPASAEGYSHIFSKVREEKHGGGKSPRVPGDNSYIYGQRHEAKKGCGCFPWGRK